MAQEKKIKMGFYLDPELKNKVSKYIPWGQTSRLYESLTEQIVELVELSGDPYLMMAAIISDGVKLEDIIKLKEKRNEAE